MPSVGSFQHPSPQVPPQRINALHVPQMRRHGAAAGVVAPPLPQAGPGSNQVRGGSHPAPRIPLRCVPLVCHPALTSGLPEARLESRSWPAPVSRHRNFRRSATGGTGPGLSPGGDTPVIVLTRACGRVAPVTRGSDVLACGFPGGARTRRSELPPPRSRDGPFGIRSAGRQPPRTEFHAFSLSRRRVGPADPQILGTPAVPVRRDGTWAFSYFSCRIARGVSIPARGVHGFLLRPFYALVGNLRFSEVRVRAATLLGYGNHDAPKRSSVPLPFAGLRCTARAQRAFGPRVIRTRIRPLAGAECTPNSNRGREAGPSANGVSLPCPGRTQACHAHLAAAENGSPETRLKSSLGLVSEGHLTGVGRPV